MIAHRNDPNDLTLPSAHVYLSERQLATLWQTSTRTLQRWRASGKGPPFLRLGGAIRYRRTDIEAFETAARSGETPHGGEP